MYRLSTSPSASVHGRTKEIHIARPGEKHKGMIKIWYPDGPAKEIDFGPAVP